MDLFIVANKSDDTVLFVDLKTGQHLGTATTGRGPHEVVVAPDGQRAYVANYEGPGDTLSVLDVAGRREVRRIRLDPYRAPHGMAFGTGGMLYVTCERSQAVIELDLEGGQVRRAFQTGQEITHMLVLTPDGRKLYTANIGSGSVTAIDLAAGEILAQVKTGDGCEGIDVTPDGRMVWTTNRAIDTISIIDVETDRVVDTLVCPGFPIRVRFTPDGGKALVACATADEVAVFDVAGRREERRIRVGTAPIGVLVEPDGEQAYIANTREDTVSILDLRHWKVVGRIPTGRTPDGMALVAL